MDSRNSSNSFLVVREFHRRFHAVLSGGFAHPVQVVMTFLLGHVEVDAGEFLAEGADVKVAFDFADAGEFFERQSW
jgi:hypothetical protein